LIRALGFLLCFMSAAIGGPLHAHLTPQTIVALDIGREKVAVEITIPAGELGYAYGAPAITGIDLRRHIRVLNSDGRAWKLSPIRIRQEQHQGSKDVIAQFTASPADGSTNRSFKFRYDAVIDRVASHVVLVVARSDFSGGTLHGSPKLLGALQGTRTELQVDLGQPNRWSGFAASARLGMHHIAEGYDHLLFLLMLLLPAPLLASESKWAAGSDRKRAVRSLLLIVTAFTIGHSLTLIGGALFNWVLPSQPVEIAIAVSILISAIHAVRPIFPGKEALVAGTFGLVHGLAFATLISNFALEPTDKAIAILGFNLGIELIQLLVVAAALPLLLLGASRPFYGHVRLAGAVFGIAAALFWLWQRIAQI
jgi:HupE / UreJ protein